MKKNVKIIVGIVAFLILLVLGLKMFGVTDTARVDTAKSYGISNLDFDDYSLKLELYKNKDTDKYEIWVYGKKTTNNPKADLPSINDSRDKGDYVFIDLVRSDELVVNDDDYNFTPAFYSDGKIRYCLGILPNEIQYVKFYNKKYETKHQTIKSKSGNTKFSYVVFPMPKSDDPDEFQYTLIGSNGKEIKYVE